jgi:hypothetical protein
MTVRRTRKSVKCCLPITPQKLRTLEELLLQLGLGNLNLNSLVHLLCVSALVIGIVLDCGREL